MSDRRRRRVNELLKEELGELLERKVSDPRLGLVTITRVETSPDLRHSRVYVSALGSAEERQMALAVLTKATSFLRKELATHLPLRYIPELIFLLDDSLLYGQRVQELLDQIEAETKDL